MSAKYFITGTDTDVGKTFVASAILARAKSESYSTLGMKPIAAGCEESPEGLRNEDALLLKENSSIQLSYQQVNPVALKPAIAPHIALQEAGKKATVDQLSGYCQGILSQKADLTLIEGAGGWRVPLNASQTLADLARSLQLPVIMVVGLRLGCISHALLTAEAILRDGLTLAGWVGNTLDTEMPRLQENIDTLCHVIPSPCFGIIPFLSSGKPREACQYLKLELIVG